jgi:hypothetical protein
MDQGMSSLQTLLFAVMVSTVFATCIAAIYFIARKLARNLFERTYRKQMQRKMLDV